MISRDAVIKTAVNLGLDGLSMGRVATRLGVATQSLYRHVSSREELIDLTVNELVKEWPATPDDGQPLEDWLQSLGTNTRTFLINNPGLAQELQVLDSGTPQVFHQIERTISTLVKRGVSPTAAFLVSKGVIDATIAAVVRRHRPTTAAQEENTPGPLSSAIAKLDPEDIPHLSGIRHFIDEAPTEDHQGVIMSSTIRGLVANLIEDAQ